MIFETVATGGYVALSREWPQRIQRVARPVSPQLTRRTTDPPKAWLLADVSPGHCEGVADCLERHRRRDPKKVRRTFGDQLSCRHALRVT